MKEAALGLGLRETGSRRRRDGRPTLGGRHRRIFAETRRYGTRTRDEGFPCLRAGSR